MSASAPLSAGKCQKPNCSNPASRTYRDGKGNTLSLCDRHYYRLVTDEISLSLGGGGL